MITPDFNPPAPQLRQFAIFAVPGLALITFAVLKITGHGWGEALTHEAILWTLAFAVLQLLVFAVGFRLLTRVTYVVLMLVAWPIGFVLANLLMALIYYFLITPIGLVFRLVGRDTMGRRFDSALKSYWHVREGDRAPASYFKLY